MNAPANITSLAFQEADARALLEQLDHIHLVAILPDAPKGAKPHGRYFGSDVDAALAFATTSNAGGFNVYWTLNYVGPSVGTKPSKGDIQAARGAHCDLDPPKDGSQWDKLAAIAALSGHPVPPSLIIDSGNGVQPVWLLDEPAKEWAPIETTNMGLRDTFGGDDCHNIDRLLRVPGSINYPGKTKRDRGCVPCMATWVQPDTGQRYQPALLAAAFPARQERKERAAAGDSGERVPTQTGALIAAIRRGDDWHNNLLRLTAHLVAKGRSTVEILAMADCLTLPGYTVEDTRADMRGMIDDARAKWDYSEPADPLGDEPATALIDLDDVADWEGIEIPARRWLLDDWLPVGEGALFTGAGAVGKSLTAQQLAKAIAAGLPFMGMQTEQATSIYITCEDGQQEVQRRDRDIGRALGARPPRGACLVKSWKGELDLELVVFDAERRMRPTKRFEALRRTALATGARFIVLDNTSHLFGGDENVKREVAAFVNLLNGLAAEIDGVVLLLGHPNKTGLNNPTAGDANQFGGSVSWENQFRSRMFMAAPDADDPDARELSNPKANYSPKGNKLQFRWHAGAFIRHEDLPSDYAAELTATIKATGENSVFMRCLEAATLQKRAVSHNPGSNYAPKVFASMTEGKGLSVKAFAGAMERLLYLGEIELDAELWKGPNRHQKTGIRAVDKCANPPAPTPCADQRQPPTQVIENPVPTLRAPPPLYPTGNSGAPLGAGTPDDEYDDADFMAGAK